MTKTPPTVSLAEVLAAVRDRRDNGGGSASYQQACNHIIEAVQLLRPAHTPAPDTRLVVEELSHLRQTVEYLAGVPAPSGVINDYRAPEVDQAILRCRERGDDDTAHVLAQMRLVYRRQSNELQDTLAALASPSPDTPEIEGRGQ